ncbi:uncharacterized protein si:dkey-192g7.3 isoform X2 [Electrophorus electricus]|nr:uncharacterized protein si:dkey-192g7.3 isoform X2 [Electrophorus electricus]
MTLRDTTVMGIDQEVSVFAGDNALLPCKCSEKMMRLVWQIGENKVVNLYNTTGSLHDSYKDRTQLFLPNKKGNCSLLLQRVSSSDQEKFMCYTFDLNDDMLDICNIRLNVQAAAQTTPGHSTNPFTSMDLRIASKAEGYAGVSIGVPFSLVALLLLAGVVIALLIRCHRQRPKTMVVVMSQAGNVTSQAGLPIMSHTAV